MTNSKSQIKSGAVLSYLSILLNIFLGLVYTPWMVKQIGQSDYGLYTLVNSLIALFMVDFGLSSATSRYVAKYRANHDEEGLKTFLSTIYRLYLLIDAIIFVVLLFVYLNINGIYQNLSAEEIAKLKVAFAIVGIYSLINFPCVTFNGILTAYEQFVPLRVADLVYRIGSVVLSVIMLLLGESLYALVLINAFCGLAVLALKFYHVRKSLGYYVSLRRKTEDRSFLKELFHFSVWTTLTSLAARLVFNITPSVLGVVCAEATAVISVFGIVATIEGYVYTFSTAINGMFLSRITRITNDKETSRKNLSNLTISVGRFQFILNSLIVVGFAVIGRDFILLWMGEKYIQAYYGILLVILPGLFFNSLQIFNTTLIVKNLVKYQALVALATGVCSFVLSVIFSHLWGVIGASAAIFSAYSLRVILTLLLIHKKLDVDLRAFVLNCYLKLSVPTVVSLLVGFYVIHFFPSGSWLYLILKAMVIVMVYAIALLLLGLKPQERASLLRRIHR